MNVPGHSLNPFHGLFYRCKLLTFESGEGWVCMRRRGRDHVVAGMVWRSGGPAPDPGVLSDAIRELKAA